MAGLGIRVEYKGADVVVRNLFETATRASDPRPAFREVGRDFLRVTGSEFSRGGIPRWAPLASSTIERKRSAGLDPRILIATGRLRDSYASEGGDHIERMTRADVEMGTKVPYAHFHRDGLKRMPKRPVTIARSDQRRWVAYVRAYVIASSR